MGELANCMNCDAVFVKNIREICQKCFEAEEKAFEIVYRFLVKRQNREATMDDIANETGVERELIVKFIKEKRLRISQFPKLSYPCDRCGNNIITGNLCHTCTQTFRKELIKHEEMTKLDQQREQEKNKKHVYYSYDKYRG